MRDALALMRQAMEDNSDSEEERVETRLRVFRDKVRHATGEHRGSSVRCADKRAPQHIFSEVRRQERKRAGKIGRRSVSQGCIFVYS